MVAIAAALTLFAAATVALLWWLVRLNNNADKGDDE